MDAKSADGLRDRELDEELAEVLVAISVITKRLARKINENMRRYTMGKMSELSAAIDEMIACGKGMVKAAEALKAFYSSEDEPRQEKKPAETKEQAVPEPAAEKTVSKEDVRRLLVAKSNADGGAYKPAVKRLVQKYSETGQLSSVPEEKYADIIAELEGIGNA